MGHQKRGTDIESPALFPVRKRTECDSVNTRIHLAGGHDLAFGCGTESGVLPLTCPRRHWDGLEPDVSSVDPATKPDYAGLSRGAEQRAAWDVSGSRRGWYHPSPADADTAASKNESRATDCTAHTSRSLVRAQGESTIALRVAHAGCVDVGGESQTGALAHAGGCSCRNGTGGPGHR